MASTKKRSLIKSIGWEFSMFVVITGLTFLWFGLTKSALYYSILVTFIKASLLFCYERIWKKVKWGKI
jgi:hypothetical protein